MPKQPDILARMPDALRQEAMKGLVMGLFGPKNGPRIWKQMDAVMSVTQRQLGDDPDPEKNYWQGTWRIYDLE
jgi:hypothetical protein